jgi:hypothetical protein
MSCVDREVSRTLWAPGVLGKIAPVPAIFMLQYANAISETKSHLKYYYNVLRHNIQKCSTQLLSRKKTSGSNDRMYGFR